MMALVVVENLVGQCLSSHLQQLLDNEKLSVSSLEIQTTRDEQLWGSLELTRSVDAPAFLLEHLPPEKSSFPPFRRNVSDCYFDGSNLLFFEAFKLHSNLLG